MNILRKTLFLLLLLLLPLESFAEQNVAPGINDHYRDADVEQWRSIFEREGREIWDHRHGIMAALDLKPGMKVADIGAGTGFLTLMFAKQVGPKGHAYAVDISANFIEGINERAKESGLTNITGVVNNARSVMLPDSSIDLAFISDTYHHFEFPQTTLTTIHSALKPNGELVVIDFRKLPGLSSSWVMGHVRAGKQEVVKEIESAGFKLTEEKKFMQGQFYLRFKKQ